MLCFFKLTWVTQITTYSYDIYNCKLGHLVITFAALNNLKGCLGLRVHCIGRLEINIEAHDHTHIH